jgi:hypothetical protein
MRLDLIPSKILFNQYDRQKKRQGISRRNYKKETHLYVCSM